MDPIYYHHISPVRSKTDMVDSSYFFKLNLILLRRLLWKMMLQGKDV
ncbi:conserved hypothetical protein [delta proteobacterium NaphS2]|nr:conserved hypothetical protein [delta proteobacterium NaphS2]